MAKAKKTMRHASALKALRQSIERRVENAQMRSRVRTLTKLVQKAVGEKNLQSAKAHFIEAQSAWQKAAQRGVIHRNVAARKISRLSSQLLTLQKS